MNSKNNFKIIIFIIVLVVFVLYFLVINKNEYDEIYVNSIIQEENIFNNVIEEQSEKIKIHIIGEVKNPGIYELEEGSRIQDVIVMAGGITERADLNKVNLAYEVEDGQKIKIPGILDEESSYIYNDSGENVIESSSNSYSFGGKININKANIAELEEINGIGPSLAEKIITYREKNGKFKKIEDLKNVSGIGDKKYEIIKEYIVVK